MPDHDTRSRTMDRPQEGFWLIRCASKGPWVPASIMRLQTVVEPGEPENRMDGTRSPFTAAYISGEVVAVDAVWLRRGRVITRAEYAKQVAEIAANRRAGRYDPRLKPYRAVEMENLELPF
jgi:hypothetical protein